MADTIKVHVVYAQADQTELTGLDLPAGSTLAVALGKSGLLERHGLSLQTAKFGIYGKLAKPDTLLRDHDRVEIYRPLSADPKEVRKARAAERKAAKKVKAASNS